MAQIESYVTITQAKALLLDMVRSLRNKTNTIAITKNGVPEAVLLSMDTYEGLLETIDILADSDAMAALKNSAIDEKTGRLLDEDQILRAL